MAKAWILNSENEINEETQYNKFEVCDRHIEVEHTQGFMRYIWMIGGLICIGAMRSTGDYTGLIIGLLGLGVIWLISRAVTTKITRDLHLIFYTERDTKHDVFFAIDIKTNEILYVQHIFADPEDEYPATVYGFDVISLDEFKNYIADKSKHYYDIVKDITPSTVNLLKNIQFGETKWKWTWFVKQTVMDKIVLGCFRINTLGEAYAKYVEFSEEEYIKYFGSCQKLREMHPTFVNEDSVVLKDSNIRTFSKKLEDSEFQTLVNIFDGDQRKCDTQIEKYFNKEFITEFEYEGNATVCDVNGIKYLQHLSDEKEGEIFTPVTFSDDQIMEEPIVEKNPDIETEQDTTNGSVERNSSTTSTVNKTNDKYKNYGLISLICALGAFISIIPLTWVAGLIFGILSIKHSNELGTKRDGKALAGVIISSIECVIAVLAVIGMIVG